MSGPKYVAEGFEEDVSKLLRDFVEECTVEFCDFARIWRDHHFSLIYMGRPDATENSEFTNEIFRATSRFLFSPSFYQRVGTVFTLFAMYRTQIIHPPIKIRIEMSHWNAIQVLFQDAISKKYKSLLYVLQYLKQHAFLYVAHQTVKGPLMGSMPKDFKNFEVISTIKSTYKSDFIEYSASNNLEALKNLHSDYLKAKRNLAGKVNLPLNADNEVYEMFIRDVKEIVDPNKKTKEEVSGNLIGERRSKIKAKSFLVKAKDRFGQVIEDDLDFDDPEQPGPSQANKKNKKKRSPKKKGRVGRPRKNPLPEVEEEEKSDVDDDIIDISHLLEQQNELYLPPDDDNKKLRSKPGRYYYKLSPKREREDEG